MIGCEFFILVTEVTLCLTTYISNTNFILLRLACYIATKVSL